MLKWAGNKILHLEQSVLWFLLDLQKERERTSWLLYQYPLDQLDQHGVTVGSVFHFTGHSVAYLLDMALMI